MTVKIIRISDEPIPAWSDDLELPPGEIGEIVVRGPVVTRSYYNRPRVDGAGEDRRPGAAVLASHGRRRLSRRRRAASGSAAASRTASSRRRERCSPSPARASSTPIPRCCARPWSACPRTAAIEPVLCVERDPKPAALRRRRLAPGTAGARRSARRTRGPSATILVPPGFPGGHPPQRQDLPREAGRLGGEAGCA